MFILFVIAVLSGAMLMLQLQAIPSYSIVFSLTGILIIFLAFYIWLTWVGYSSSNSSRSNESSKTTFNKLYTSKHHAKLRFCNNFNYPQSDFLFSIYYLLMTFLLGFLLGTIWVFWQLMMHPKLPDELANKKSIFIGQISSLVSEETSKSLTKLKFELKPSQIVYEQQKIKASSLSILNAKQISGAIKVTWYLPAKDRYKIDQLPELGEKWLFYGKFRNNHASINEFSQDYEAWLLQKGIVGRLSVSGLKQIPSNLSEKLKLVDSKTADPKTDELELFDLFAILKVYKNAEDLTQLHVSEGLLGFVEQINGLRNYVSKNLNQLFENSNYSAIYRALLIGDKSAISNQQWSLFQKTGTIHLMAISGLHMSIMALLGFLFAKLVWWIGFYRQRVFILPAFSAFIAFIFASYYLFIAGASIPTQRAWIMVVTVIIFLAMRRKFQPFTALAVAAFVVVLWDVSALLSSGFWLSFMAVWLIFHSLRLISALSNIQKTIVVQMVLSLALLPLIAWLYFEVPLYSFIANFIAVPFVTFIGLPVLLFAQLISLFDMNLARDLVSVTDALWSGLFLILNEIQYWPHASFNIPSLSVFNLVIFYLGWVFISFIANKTVFKIFTPLVATSTWLLVMIFYTVSSGFVAVYANQNKSQGTQLEMRVFDVGQGQAIAFKTLNYLIIYDAGAKWGSKTDAAKVAMLPYLKSQGISTIDKLFISHSDIDHAGGADTLISNFTIAEALSGQADKLNKMTAMTSVKNKVLFSQCLAGQSWHYDGINFSILSPHLNDDIKDLSDNDASCVLKVTGKGISILIMGDLSIKAEQKLISKYKEALQADVLIAGHHGSRSSTSLEFLQMVRPNHVVFSAGYNNRFGFPNKEVIARLKVFTKDKTALRWWNTACSGELIFNISNEWELQVNELRKQQGKWYHHRCSIDQQGILYQ